MLFFPFFRLNCGFIGFWVMKVFVSFFFSPQFIKFLDMFHVFTILGR